MNDLDSPNLPVPASPRNGERPPGHDLKPRERRYIEFVASKNLSAAEAARSCRIPERTGQSWLTKPAGRRYFDSLVAVAVDQAQTRIRNSFAQAGPKVAQRVSQMAEGKGRKGKPSHPYQHFYASMVLDRLAPKPAGSSGDLGIKVPTEHGDVVIVWHSNATPGTQHTENTD